MRGRVEGGGVEVLVGIWMGILGWEPWAGGGGEVGLNVVETLVPWMFSFGRASSASKIGSLYRFVYRLRNFFLMCT